MAEQTPQPNTPATSATSPAVNAAATQAGADPARTTSTKPDEVRTALTPSDPDPMRELLDQLQRAQPLIAGFDRSLAERVQILAQQGTDPDHRAQAGFRHRVAYAIEDLEKLPLRSIPMASELRSEITRLANSAPGLENPRMLGLMHNTADLKDRQLISDIRRAAADIGSRRDQNTPSIESSIDALENRYRLARYPSIGAAADQHPNQQAAAAQAAAPRQPPRGDPFATMMRGMWPSDGSPTATDPTHTPMADRFAAFEARIQGERDDRALARAETSGRAALAALDGFRAGEGATIMNRIRAAAQSEPGGLAQVLSEMREGGRFADLRRQFNNALETERGVTAAYDKAASALARYGQDRFAVEQVIARRPDAANLTAKFERMDAEIGEAAAATPSRRDAKSMIDDLAQKAAEMLQRAADAVKSVFNRSPAADAGQRAAPSPSMSP